MSQTTEIHSPAEVERRKKIDMRAGDTVRVSVKIEEKGKTRTQDFEGIVLARKHGNEPGATFTVRRTTGGIGVEKIFPLFSPVIEKIEVLKHSKVKQSNLYHIRRKAAKEVKRHIKNVRSTPDQEEEEVAEEVIQEEEVEKEEKEVDVDTGEVVEEKVEKEEENKEEAKKE